MIFGRTPEQMEKRKARILEDAKEWRPSFEPFAVLTDGRVAVFETVERKAKFLDEGGTPTWNPYIGFDGGGVVYEYRVPPVKAV